MVCVFGRCSRQEDRCRRDCRHRPMYISVTSSVVYLLQAAFGCAPGMESRSPLDDVGFDAALRVHAQTSLRTLCVLSIPLFAAAVLCVAHAGCRHHGRTST